MAPNQSGVEAGPCGFPSDPGAPADLRPGRSPRGAAHTGSLGQCEPARRALGSSRRGQRLSPHCSARFSHSPCSGSCCASVKSELVPPVVTTRDPRSADAPRCLSGDVWVCPSVSPRLALLQSVSLWTCEQHAGPRRARGQSSGACGHRVSPGRAGAPRCAPVTVPTSRPATDGAGGLQARCGEQAGRARAGSRRPGEQPRRAGRLGQGGSGSPGRTGRKPGQAEARGGLLEAQRGKGRTGGGGTVIRGQGRSEQMLVAEIAQSRPLGGAHTTN